MVRMSRTSLLDIRDALEDALAEVEQCEDISQGVEDKLQNALRISNDVLYTRENNSG